VASLVRAAGDVIIVAFTSYTESRMGKGDVRTRRGKTFNGSYGKKRPHKPKKKKHS